MRKRIALFYFLQVFCFTHYAHALQVNPIHSDQKLIFDAINYYRLEHGLSSLKLNETVSKEARKHSRDMATKQVAFGHTGFKKRANSIFKRFDQPQAIAENVAYIDGNIKNIVTLWLNSRGHKKNIEGRYNLTGIGIAYDKNGVAFVTQIFLNA